MKPVVSNLPLNFQGISKNVCNWVLLIQATEDRLVAKYPITIGATGWLKQGGSRSAKKIKK